MDWYATCWYEPERKRRFHATARARLRKLAGELRLPAGSFDLRSNQGGIAVSGEAILHHEKFYVHVSQPAIRANTGILILDLSWSTRLYRRRQSFRAAIASRRHPGACRACGRHNRRSASDHPGRLTDPRKPPP